MSVRRALLLLATMALATALSGGVAQAIINGGPDRGPNAHPYVGALVTKVEGQLQNFCSGTLISPKVFLTAGHCTVPPKGKGVPKDQPTYVTFDPTFEPGSSKIIKGTPYTHPKACFPIAPFNDRCAPPPGLPRFPSDFPRYDVGVVVLNKPVRMATYGALPDAGLVDTLEKGQRFTAVGYGLRTFDPPAANVTGPRLGSSTQTTPSAPCSSRPRASAASSEAGRVLVRGIQAGRCSCPTRKPSWALPRLAAQTRLRACARNLSTSNGWICHRS
jgi:Trypsin